MATREENPDAFEKIHVWLPIGEEPLVRSVLDELSKVMSQGGIPGDSRRSVDGSFNNLNTYLGRIIGDRRTAERNRTLATVTTRLEAARIDGTSTLSLTLDELELLTKERAR